MSQRAIVTRGQVLAALILVVLSFGIVAWSQQQGQADLRDYVHQACLSRAENVQRLNDQARAFIEVERDNPYGATSPETIARRIAIYEASILIVPDCSAL